MVIASGSGPPRRPVSKPSMAAVSSGQLEVEHVDVLCDAAWLGGLWNDGASVLQTPVVYVHFGSKDELYVARGAQRFHLALDEAVGPVESPEARLWTGILTLLDHVERERAEWTMLFAGPTGTEPVAREAARIRRETEALIAALFTET